MRSRLAWCMVFVIVGMLVMALRPISCPAAEKEKMLSHDVYFSLTDNSPEAKEKLVAACKKYLSGHPGTIWFAAGPLAEEMQRDVNDRDFDVALHLVFKDKAAHDQYAKAERHMKFIEETKPNWKKVRVFDSYLEVSSHEGMAMERDQPAGRKRDALPEAAAGFAGMIEGKVAQKFDDGITLAVTKVVKQWEHNQTKDSQSLVGKTVMVKAIQGEANVARFLKVLKAGEVVSLDVADKGNGVLTILELTEDQRERVGKAAADK